jgi:hypothetical protein
LAPASEPGDRFLAAAERALPGVRPMSGGDRDEVVFYRARLGLTAADLERLDLVSPEVYAQACAAESFTPHARLDIPWRGLGEVVVSHAAAMSQGLAASQSLGMSQSVGLSQSLAQSQGLAESQPVAESQSDQVTR